MQETYNFFLAYLPISAPAFTFAANDCQTKLFEHVIEEHYRYWCRNHG